MAKLKIGEMRAAAGAHPDPRVRGSIDAGAIRGRAAALIGQFLVDEWNFTPRPADDVVAFLKEHVGRNADLDLRRVADLTLARGQGATMEEVHHILAQLGGSRRQVAAAY